MYNSESIMKLSTLLLSLLALTLLHQALSTHLQTCECHQIRELVNTTVQEALTGLENRLNQTSLIATMERLLKPIQQQLNYHLPPPEGTQDNPATSCKALHEQAPQAASGYYWIGEFGSAVRVYCSMSGTCGSETGGWMRVAHLDMRNTSHTCPSGLTTLTSPKRLCDLSSHSTCASNTYRAHQVQYSHVCGKITAYEKFGAAFYYHYRSIEEAYIYGISLTHGRNPRKHVWTFATANDETAYGSNYKCPCINAVSRARPIPSYVGNDYFCDTAYETRNTAHALQTTDPLWDGKGCGSGNTCCTLNSPPWFVKDLPSPTTDDIEMRVCRPSGSVGSLVEIVELYVQ